MNRVGFRKIYRQESTIIFPHNCTDSSYVLCLSLLAIEKHFGSDILDKQIIIPGWTADRVHALWLIEHPPRRMHILILYGCSLADALKSFILNIFYPIILIL